MVVVVVCGYLADHYCFFFENEVALKCAYDLPKSTNCVNFLFFVSNVVLSGFI